MSETQTKYFTARDKCRLDVIENKKKKTETSVSLLFIVNSDWDHLSNG